MKDRQSIRTFQEIGLPYREFAKKSKCQRAQFPSPSKGTHKPGPDSLTRRGLIDPKLKQKQKQSTWFCEPTACVIGTHRTTASTTAQQVSDLTVKRGCRFERSNCWKKPPLINQNKKKKASHHVSCSTWRGKHDGLGLFCWIQGLWPVQSERDTKPSKIMSQNICPSCARITLGRKIRDSKHENMEYCGAGLGWTGQMSESKETLKCQTFIATSSIERGEKIRKTLDFHYTLHMLCVHLAVLICQKWLLLWVKVLNTFWFINWLHNFSNII